MNTKTMKEAHLNLRKVFDEVDENGSVIITKNGKEKYVIMTIDKYHGKSDFEIKMEKALFEGLWVDITDQVVLELRDEDFEETGKTICWAKQNGEIIQILKMHFFEGEDYPEYCSEFVTPADNLEILDRAPIIIRIKDPRSIRYAGAYMSKAEDKKEKAIVKSVEKAMEDFPETPLQPAVLKGSPIFEA